MTGSDTSITHPHRSTLCDRAQTHGSRLSNLSAHSNHSNKRQHTTGKGMASRDWSRRRQPLLLLLLLLPLLVLLLVAVGTDAFVSLPPPPPPGAGIRPVTWQSIIRARPGSSGGLGSLLQAGPLALGASAAAGEPRAPEQLHFTIVCCNPSPSIDQIPIDSFSQTHAPQEQQQAPRQLHSHHHRHGVGRPERRCASSCRAGGGAAGPSRGPASTGKPSGASLSRPPCFLLRD
jgi:hypothetical protein